MWWRHILRQCKGHSEGLARSHRPLSKEPGLWAAFVDVHELQLARNTLSAVISDDGCLDYAWISQLTAERAAEDQH